MLEHIKKYGVIAIIAILFAFFSFSIVDIIFEEPDYRDCGLFAKPMMPPNESCPDIVPKEAYQECGGERGNIELQYGPNGCPVSYECNTCYAKQEDDRKQHREVGFIVTAIIGLIAIIFGLYARTKDDVVEWVYAGLLIGGLITVFAGTVSYFGDMDRFLRPVVLLLEIALIIFVAVKTSQRK